MNNTPVSIFWFRRDLRLEDNHGLFECLKNSNSVLPIFIFDKNILGKLENKKDKRVQFIYQAILDLNKKIQQNGSSLLAIYDSPTNAFKDILSKYQVKAVYTNSDYEPYAIQRDEEIAALLASSGVEFHIYKDQVIFEKNEILKGDGKPYTIFTPYSRPWKEKFKTEGVKNYPSEDLLKNFAQSEPISLPSIEELGFDKSNQIFKAPTIDKEIISNYHLTRNQPFLPGTTLLSVHLRFGTVSIRKLATLAADLNEQWLNELIWREFFMMILYHFPHVVKQCFKSKYENINWRNNEHEFEAWCKGETGYPIVDAGMRELNETGFMHNRVRMIVASFLTKDLLIDWRWGENYFAEKLLDYDLSANNGNWQWAAGSGCDSAPYFRIFNPNEQTKKFDPQLKYIKKWIKDFDNYLITPIVEHDFARKRCLDVYKKGIGAAE